MAATALRARSTPYRPALLAKERVCTRCGITFTLGQPKRDSHLTRCVDCRRHD